MANAYVSSVAHAAVAQWAALTAYTLGQYVRQLAAPAVGSERVFKCTTAGTSGAAEPTWNLTNNSTTTDSTAVWTQVAGQEAEQAAGNWKAPFARIETAISVLVLVANDTVFVSNDHAQTAAAAVTIGSVAGPFKILSVSRTGAALPPVSADLLAGASVATTGANTLTISCIYAWGLTFSAASGSSNAGIALTPSSTGLLIYLDTCALILNTTSSFPLITSSGVFHNHIILENTTVQFGHAGQGIAVGNGNLEWRGAGSSVVGATLPTTLLSGAGGNAGHQNLIVDGVDLSAITGTLVGLSLFTGLVDVTNCKVNASATLTGTNTTAALARVRIHNCDSTTGGRNYNFKEAYLQGNVVPSITVVRTGGASDGVTPLSHLYTVFTTTYLKRPLYGPWIGRRQNTVGAARTCTIELIQGTSAALTNTQLWVDLQSLDTSNTPINALHTSCVADVLAAGATLTASTEAWDSAATARANTTAYSVGDIRKVASNPGRLFVCTTGGTSAGSEPAGYASAVDGGSVTDNTAVFRAMWRHKVTIAFTPQMKGMIRARVNINLAAASTVYVDPKLVIA